MYFIHKDLYKMSQFQQQIVTLVQKGVMQNCNINLSSIIIIIGLLSVLMYNTL